MTTAFVPPTPKVEYFWKGQQGEVVRYRTVDIAIKFIGNHLCPCGQCPMPRLWRETTTTIPGRREIRNIRDPLSLAIGSVARLALYTDSRKSQRDTQFFNGTALSDSIFDAQLFMEQDEALWRLQSAAKKTPNDKIVNSYLTLGYIVVSAMTEDVKVEPVA